MFLQLGYGVFYAFIVDTHPVDDGPVFDQAEQPGLGIAWLGLRSQGTDLHETESEIAHVVVELSVLVQAGCKAYRIPESEPEYVPFELSFFVAHSENGAYYVLGQRYQYSECDGVRCFRREREKYTSY